MPPYPTVPVLFSPTYRAYHGCIHERRAYESIYQRRSYHERASYERAYQRHATNSNLPVLCSRTLEASKGLKPPEAADLPTSATHIQIDSYDIISVLPEDGILPMTHGDGLAILDEYFEQPATGAGPVNDADSLGNRSMILSESSNQDGTLEATASFGTSRSEQQLQTVGKSAVSETFAKPNPDLAAASAATSESGSGMGSSEVGSLFTDPTSTASSEARINNDLLTSEIQHPPFLKRAALDESAQWLEGVLIALEEVDDTSRKLNNSVSGYSDHVFTESEFAQCVKVMTGIAENVVKYTRCMAKPVPNAGQDPSRAVGRNKFSSHGRRLTTGCALQTSHQTHHSDDISQRGKRDLVEMEMQRLLSKPDELIGDFKEDIDYETALKHIEKDNADDAKIQLRRLWKETFYWPMIQQRAKMIGLLPKSSGRKTEITPQEKSAAKKLILALGILNSLICYSPGIGPYDLPLRQLGARTIAEEEDDFSGKSDIEEKWIFDRLHAPQNVRWGDHLSVWDEDSIDLIPYEGESWRRTLGSYTGSTGLLAVVPLVPILPGDFLGIFPGRLRFTDQKPPRSIPGPVANLWLEYSVITGRLGKMRVAKADEMTNVCPTFRCLSVTPAK
ncbi:hypothetical protein V500_08742 [Pseudogymnoascus sp. VKM F-4518 (FW-2643)]|nr:hypothetical protein V500_08742 [Pseudogymnoascus sp. VKM F-4518 (FW-2643)]